MCMRVNCVGLNKLSEPVKTYVQGSNFQHPLIKIRELCSDAERILAPGSANAWPPSKPVDIFWHTCLVQKFENLSDQAILSTFLFCDLNPHAKFQNPAITPSG
jgi:hypothetical protein